MKLPGWQASISTAMPRKSPALQGSPAMVKPKVMNFVALQNPNDYLRLGQAKAQKYSVIGDTVSKSVDMVTSIIEADEEARARAEVAKHAELLASWEVENTYKAPLRESDGQGGYSYPWKDIEERYNSVSQSYKDTIEERNNFSTKNARAILEKGFSANDKTYRTNIQKFVRDREIDTGRAAVLDEVELYKQTGNRSAIDYAFNQSVQKGLYGEVEARTLKLDAIADMHSKTVTRSVNNLRSLSYDIDDDSFDALYEAERQRLLAVGHEMDDSDFRANMKQLVNLKSDYEDTIRDERAMINYAKDLNYLSDVILAGDQRAINLFFSSLETPGAADKYGDHYEKMITFKNEFKLEGKTSPGSTVTIATLVEGLRDGTYDAGDATTILTNMHRSASISPGDTAAAIKAIGTAGDARSKEVYNMAKQTISIHLLKATDPNYISFEEKKDKAANIRLFNAIMPKVYNYMDKARQEGKSLSLDELLNVGFSEIVNATPIEVYMRDKNGNKAETLWDIDETASLTYIDAQLEKTLATAKGLENTYARTDANKHKENLNRLLKLGNDVERPETN